MTDFNSIYVKDLNPKEPEYTYPKGLTLQDFEDMIKSLPESRDLPVYGPTGDMYFPESGTWLGPGAAKQFDEEMKKLAKK